MKSTAHGVPSVWEQFPSAPSKFLSFLSLERLYSEFPTPHRQPLVSEASLPGCPSDQVPEPTKPWVNIAQDRAATVSQCTCRLQDASPASLLARGQPGPSGGLQPGAPGGSLAGIPGAEPAVAGTRCSLSPAFPVPPTLYVTLGA